MHSLKKLVHQQTPHALRNFSSSRLLYAFMNPFTKDQSEQEIKKTFRQWAHKHHPDCGGTKEDFVKLRVAYENALKGIFTGSTQQTYKSSSSSSTYSSYSYKKYSYSSSQKTYQDFKDKREKKEESDNKRNAEWERAEKKFKEQYKQWKMAQKKFREEEFAWKMAQYKFKDAYSEFHGKRFGRKATRFYKQGWRKPKF